MPAPGRIPVLLAGSSVHIAWVSALIYAAAAAAACVGVVMTLRDYG